MVRYRRSREWLLHSISRCAVALLALCLLPADVWAQTTTQRSCTFRLAVQSDLKRRDVNLGVVVAARGAAARVVVNGSGDYSGRSAQTGSAQTVTFRTPVSSEEMTIGATGEALWMIDYDREPPTAAVITYFGSCAAPRKTG